MSTTKKHRVTLRDVANVVGVSPMAVSRVLHGQGGTVRVSDARAALIREAARNLGYRPNAIARSLRSRRTHSLAIVWEGIPEFSITNPYGAFLLSGALPAAFSQGYDLALCRQFVQNDGVALPDDGRFDGIILCRIEPDHVKDDALLQQSVPVVLLHTPPFGAKGIRCVGWDNVQACEQLIDHLVSLGHRQIAYVMEKHLRHHPDLRIRMVALDRIARKRGLPRLQRVWIDEPSDVIHWYKQQSETTALLYWSEATALHGLRDLENAGISVPGEVSVAAFDSTEFANNSSPSLTCARQPLADMARRAVEMIIDRLDGDAKLWNDVTFPSVLDVRESTGRSRLSSSILL